MSRLPISTYVFWIAPAVIQAVVIIMMRKRKLIRELPYFCSYAAFGVASSCMLYIVLRQSGARAYFACFATVEVISLVLGLFVISEVFSKIFMNYEALQQLGWVLFRWAVIVLVGLAVLTAAAAPGQYEDRALTALMLMSRSVRVIQAGLLLLLFMFTTYFGISWKNYLFGIALGFGVLGSIELGATALLTTRAVSHSVFHFVSGAADSCASLIWAAYMIAPSRRTTIDLLPQGNLDEWNHALLGLLHR
jgi:hypothetical protein